MAKPGFRAVTAEMVAWFAKDVVGKQCITQGSFSSVKELAHTIIAVLAERNAHPKRYVWRAKGEDILPLVKAKLGVQ